MAEDRRCGGLAERLVAKDRSVGSAGNEVATSGISKPLGWTGAAEKGPHGSRDPSGGSTDGSDPAKHATEASALLGIEANGEFSHGLGPECRFRIQRFDQELADMGRNISRDVMARSRRTNYRRFGWGPAQQRPEGRRQPVYIDRRPVDRCPGDHLWGGIVNDRLRGVGQMPANAVDTYIASAEIADLRSPIVGQQQIGGSDVTMEDVGLMSQNQVPGHGPDDGNGSIRSRRMASLDHGLQRTLLE